jgi:hypothetical protein
MYCANKNRGGEYWFKSSPWLQQFNSNKKNVIIWPTTYAVSIIVIAAINLASDKISIIACTWLLIYYCSCMQTITRWGWWWCTAGPQGASIPSDPRNKSLTRLGKSANATAICKKSKRACAAHGPGRCGVRGVHARAFHILPCVCPVRPSPSPSRRPPRLTSPPALLLPALPDSPLAAQPAKLPTPPSYL